MKNNCGVFSTAYMMKSLNYKSCTLASSDMIVF